MHTYPLLPLLLCFPRRKENKQPRKAGRASTHKERSSAFSFFFCSGIWGGVSFFFFLSLVGSHLAGDSVQLSLSGGSDSSAASRVVVHNFEGLELLENGSNDGARGSHCGVLPHTSSLLATQLSLQGTYTNYVLQVHLSGDSSSSDVVPVGVLGRELLVNSCLHKVGPAGYLKLASALQVGGELSDEISGLHVSNSNGHSNATQNTHTTREDQKKQGPCPSKVKKSAFLQTQRPYSHTSCLYTPPPCSIC